MMNTATRKPATGTSQADGPVVSVEAVTKIYPGQDGPALDGVSFTVSAGEVVGLLGPNGAGKSTLVGCATTTVVPTAGRVRIGGVDLAVDSVAAKRLLGVVPQHNTLDRQVSAYENLYLHCRYFGIDRGESRRRAYALLDLFGLADRATASVATLSGGQARRLQVARALAHSPRVVFLDEPTVGLDPQSRQLVWELITALRDHGTAVVLSTHYMDEAEALAGRVAVIDHGRVIALDAPSALTASVGADAVITLTVDGEGDGDLADSLTRVRGVHAAQWFNGGDAGGTVRVLVAGDPDAALAAIVQRVPAHHLTAIAVEPVNLQTVFFTLTGRSLRD